ncbi:MAG: stage II sporulation protein R [Ruminococcaceae bacterium]|nr:stage II sporulation protein R [Oscillospiraceae bacterium]
MKIKRRNIELAVLFGLIFSIVLSLAHFDAACDDLRNNVLRLHILANSDSDADQDLKLMVRDAILEEAGHLFDGQTQLEDAITVAKDNLDNLTCIANSVIAKNGFLYTARLEIGNSYFENREYDDFTLPAGNYPSLIIKLGKAKGKNWWCVVFPAVCVSAAGEAELSDSTSNESSCIAKSYESYKVRFKVVEIYEEIKRFFS